MNGDDGPVDDARAVVVGRLRARLEDLVQAIFARASDDAFFGVIGAADVEYVAGLRATVAAAVGYSLEGIEHGEDRAGAIPMVALEQARRAARVGVPLDTVLRRYVLGSSLLGEFIMDEIDHGAKDWVSPVQRDALRGALRAQASVLDRLLIAVTAEYGDEAGRRDVHPSSTGGGGVPMLPGVLGNPSARRARECLLFLAEHPGASNRGTASGIGVTHQPQISRLLSQLAEEDLVAKSSRGAGRRNAWRLTPRGEDVLRMLARDGV